MSAARPLPVSVLIPAHNRAGLIGRALESVAAQAPARPAETIVVDDGSDDDTAAVAERLGARVVRHERNRGTAAARNTGAEAATQPWLALLDSDDEWLPHHLAHLWELQPGYGLVAAAARYENADGLPVAYHGMPARAPTELRSPAPLLFPGNLIPASAAMVRRDLVAAVGGFRPPDAVEDLDLWLRVIEREPALVSPEVTVVYHLHGAQSSDDAAKMQRLHLTIGDRYADRPWWSPALVEGWRANAAWNDVRSAVRRGRPVVAARRLGWIAARPRRIAAVVSGRVHRARLRRRGRGLRVRARE